MLGQQCRRCRCQGVVVEEILLADYSRLDKNDRMLCLVFWCLSGVSCIGAGVFGEKKLFRRIYFLRSMRDCSLRSFTRPAVTVVQSVLGVVNHPTPYYASQVN